MSKPIALYQEKSYFRKAILFELGWLSYVVRLVKFFRLDYIDSICLVKWQGLIMLHKLVNLLMLISKVRIVMLLRLD